MADSFRYPSYNSSSITTDKVPVVMHRINTRDRRLLRNANEFFRFVADPLVRTKVQAVHCYFPIFLSNYDEKYFFFFIFTVEFVMEYVTRIQ